MMPFQLWPHVPWRRVVLLPLVVLLPAPHAILVTESGGGGGRPHAAHSESGLEQVAVHVPEVPIHPVPMIHPSVAQ